MRLQHLRLTLLFRLTLPFTLRIFESTMQPSPRATKLKHPEIFTKPEIMPCSLRQSSMRTGPRIPENLISKTPSDPKIAAPGVICFREAWLSTFSGNAIGLCNLKQWPAEASTSESRASPGDQTQGDIAKAAGGYIDRQDRNTLRTDKRDGRWTTGCDLTPVSAFGGLALSRSVFCFVSRCCASLFLSPTGVTGFGRACDQLEMGHGQTLNRTWTIRQRTPSKKYKTKAVTLCRGKASGSASPDSQPLFTSTHNHLLFGLALAALFFNLHLIFQIT